MLHPLAPTALLFPAAIAAQGAPPVRPSRDTAPVAIAGVTVGVGDMATDSELLQRVPDTTSYVVLNHGRPAGEMEVVAAADSVLVRFQYQDRQRGPRILTRYRLGRDGAMLATEARGLSAAARPDAISERFEVVNDTARWRYSSDSGRARHDPGAFYWPRSPTPYDDALLARFLLRRPGRSARLLPVGAARAHVAADTTVSAAGTATHLRMAVLEGTGLQPTAVWLDDRDALVASDARWFITVRRGAESVLPALRAVERAYHARRADSLARYLSSSSGTVVIRNGDVFDSERGVVRPRTTVVVVGDRITAVGPADAVRTPTGATVVDATGKTVIPGLWDMHTHTHFTGEATAGLLQLAAGITTVRDVGADPDAAVARRDRAARGTLLSPRVLLAGFIEGPGRWAGPSEALVSTEDEARAWVARYDSLGYRQIKLYNLVHPDLVPTIAAETHKRGMRLGGHIPRGLSVPAAIALGFDEINHAAFLFSTFFQDSLYAPQMRAYSQVASAVAPTFDVEAPRVTALIALLREHRTVVDGTFNLFEDRSRPLPDGADPVFGPTLAWLPPLVRLAQTPALPASPEEGVRARAASANYRRLLKRLFDAGVTLVPGTDNMPGLSYHGELEIYARAGIPSAKVLQIATIVPARVMGEEREYGSVTPGKVADLVIVDGRPAEDIRHLRRSAQVMRAGKLYRTADLYRAAGVTPTVAAVERPEAVRPAPR